MRTQADPQRAIFVRQKILILGLVRQPLRWLLILARMLWITDGANVSIRLEASGYMTSSTGIFTSHGGIFDANERVCTLWEDTARVYFTLHSFEHNRYCVIVCFSGSVPTSVVATPAPRYGVAVVQMNRLYCTPEPQDASGDVVNLAVRDQYVTCRWNGHTCYDTEGMLTTLRLGAGTVSHARIGTAANALADDCLLESGAEQCRYIPDRFDDDIFNHDGDVIYSQPSDLAVVLGFGTDMGADIDVVVWGASNRERESKQYCLIDVGGMYPDPFGASVERMCNMKCTLRRVNMTVPVVPGRQSEGVGIGWDTSSFEIDISFEDGIDWLARGEFDAAKDTRCWERRWDRQPIFPNAPAIVASCVVGLLLLGSVCCYVASYQRRNRGTARTEAQQVFLTAEGCNVHLSQFLNVTRRLAVVVANQSYMHYSTQGVQCCYADGVALEGFFRRHFDKVIVVQDATLDDFKRLPTKIISEISGLERPLVPIVYTGHAIEVGSGNLLFAPVDAHPDDPTSHFSKADLCRDLHDLNSRRLQREMQREPTLNAIFVVMADCCRRLPRELGPFVAHISSRRFSNSVILHSRVADVTRPRFFIAYACDPHRKARTGANLSYFTHAFLEEAHVVRPLVNLFASVDARMAQLTGSLQRLWMSSGGMESSLGLDGMCVSLVSEQDSKTNGDSSFHSSSTATVASSSAHGATAESVSLSSSIASCSQF